MRVAFLGPDGSFSSQAARGLVTGGDLLPRASFDAIWASLAAGEADVAVLPVVNRLAGAVPGILDALGQPERSIVRLLWLPVDLVVLGLPGACLEQLREVRSHPVALTQLPSAWGHGRSRIQSASTAAAAEQVALGGDPAVAAFADRSLATSTNLVVLDEPLAHIENATLFASVATIPAKASGMSLHLGPSSEAPADVIVTEGASSLWGGEASTTSIKVGSIPWPIPSIS